MTVRIRLLAAVIFIALVLMVVPRVSEAVHLLFVKPPTIAGADLMVTKTGPELAAAATNVSFAVNLTNLGSDDAVNVSLTDAVPVGMTFVSATQNTGPAFDCSSVPLVGTVGTITCTAEALPASTSATFTFVMKMPETPTSAVFTNTASATSATPDPNHDNNAGTAQVTSPQADLFVTKTGPASAPANTDVSFEVTIVNLGPDDDAGVSLKDTLPQGQLDGLPTGLNMTFVSNTQTDGPAFSCVNPTVGSSGQIDCSIESFPLNSSATFTFVFHVPSGAEAGTTFTNVATGSSSQSFDPNDENNSSSATVTIPGAASADLLVTKSGPANALPDSNVPFTIVVTNAGPTAAASVIVSDTLPGDMTFVSLIQNNGPAFDCSSVPAVGSGGTVTCTLATMDAGASATFTLTTHIPAETSSFTVYQNNVTVSSTSPDPNDGNNTGTASVTVSSADLSITKTGPATANAGENIVWTIILQNSGPDVAFNASFVDQLPSGTTFVSLVQNNGPSANTCTTPAVGQNGTVSCTIISGLGGGVSAQFTLTAKIGNTLGFTNTATASSENADSNTDNNSSSVTTAVTPSANLTVTKTDSPDPVVAGENITYTVTISNSGVSDAQNVSLVDPVPGNTTFVSATQSSGPTFTCTAPAAGAAAGNVNCTTATLTPGASAVFSIVVRVNSGVSSDTTISNTATGATTTNESNTENNTGTATTGVITSADLSVVKIDSPDPVLAGNNLTYTITVTNNGPSAAQNLQLSDTLPANTTLVSFTVPGGWTRTDAVPVGGTGAVTATAQTLLAGASAQFTLVVNVNAGTADNTTITNAAIVTTSTPDSNGGNNTGTAETTVINRADLSITKSDAPDPVFAGNNLTYTINFKNNGPLTANSVTVTDAVPANTTFVSAVVSTGSGWTINNPPVGGTGNVVFSRESVPDQETATFTIVVNVNQSTPHGSIITNTAVAASTTPDPNGNNNSATATTSVASYPDLTIAKSHSGNFSSGQVGATYTITVTNIGAGPTSGLVTVTDNVPVGLTPTGPNGTVGGWSCSINGQTLTCTRSDVLAGGASYPAINLTVNVANPAPLSVTNTATVSGGGEVNTDNNTASDPTTINCSPNFALNNGSPLLISRFRENGPAGPQDEFVEIYNPTQAPHTVASGNCNGGGYGVYASAGNGTTSNAATLVCSIPNGTVIPGGGYYLCTGVTYSLGNLGRNGGVAGATATGDAPIGCNGTCGANIPDDAGLVLFNRAAPTLAPPGGFGIVEFGDVLYDKVGFGPYVGIPAPGYPTLANTYCEGGVAGCLKPVGDASSGAACANPSGLFPVFPAPPACYGLAGQYEFLRRQTTFDANQGTLHQDTNNNGNDFILVAPNPATNMGMAVTGVAGVTAVLGAAAPHNRQAPPDIPAVKLTRSPFDGAADQLGPRNLERRYIPDPTVVNPANDPLGTLTLRFRYTNNSGLPINGMRFSVDNLSTLCGPQSPTPSGATVGTGDARNVSSTPGCGTGSFTAILKALNSTAEVLVDSGATARFVNGTVLEDLSVGAAPGAGPLSPNGGGIDNTFIINPSTDNASVGDGVTGGVGNFATTMGTSGAGQVIRVQVKFGVVRNGRFILLVVPMASNSPAP